MGKKSNNKGKEKRLARKEEQQRIAASKAVVDKANALIDPLEPFPVFKQYNNSGLECELFIKRVTDLDEKLKDWAFDLTKKNMMSKYEASSWGWSEKKKLEELTDEAAWYLIAQSKDGVPMGFAHFRFDMDEGMEVLYCYELQLESKIHRKGLGKFMMQIMELIAFKNNMRKVVLTILKNNSDSKFFKAINYQLDETSPEDDEEETFCYEILSKVNKKLAATNPLPLQPVNNRHFHTVGHTMGHTMGHGFQCCPDH